MMRVRFVDVCEIRMGSPYNGCSLKIDADWDPKLENSEYQNVVCYGPASRFVGLVQWSISEDNNPGFQIVILDDRERRITRSARIEGCCDGITWRDRGVHWSSSTGEEGSLAP